MKIDVAYRAGDQFDINIRGHTLTAEAAMAADRILTDTQWGQVAAEIMHATGLAPREDPHGVRWIAIRHADDHIHLVATLARTDNRIPRPNNDFYRIRDTCRHYERHYGLTPTAPADRTAARRTYGTSPPALPMATKSTPQSATPIPRS